METITTTFVRNIITERPRTMHKGQAGRVLIIAGSKGMMGAAVLAVRGALYSGSGLVKAAVPEDQFVIMQTTVPEAMCVDRSTLAKAADHGDDAYTELDVYDAVCIGPGLGISHESAELVKIVLQSYKGPIVVDADAINCLCRYDGLDLTGPNTILTPHPGEADRILSRLRLAAYRDTDRAACIKKINSATGSAVLLKGAETLVTDGTGLYRNPTGNPGMATGGSGDVLSGIITSLLAQKTIGPEGHGVSPVEAAAAGAFLHGLAGDIAAENVGEYGMTAADIADAVSVAFKEILTME